MYINSSNVKYIIKFFLLLIFDDDLIQSSCPLIFDLDVHQGDGTAKIFENDENVFTLSIHSKKNYPLNKQLKNFHKID